jgi:hypothetical protein
MAAVMKTATDRSSVRTTTPRRPFRLLDAMILVAATAAGCGLTRWIHTATEGEISWSSLSETWETFLQTLASDGWTSGVQGGTYHLSCTLLMLAGLTVPLVATWTLALIPIRLISPRPPFRRLARQPGMMATCASGLAFALCGLQILFAVLAVATEGVMEQFQSFFVEIDFDGIVLNSLMFAGLAVLTTWMTLLAGRIWRAEPSWIDRLGRAAGVFWIVAGFAVKGLYFHALWNQSVCHFTVRTIGSK